MTRPKTKGPRGSLRILFLDIDGVLNSDAWVRQCIGTGKSAWHDMDPTAVRHLRRIVQTTKCDIVISSSWRCFYSLDEIAWTIKQAGWGSAPLPIIGETPQLPGPLLLGAVDDLRGREVEAWLQAHEHYRYCILDDKEWFLPHQPLVLTDYRVGLTADDAERCITLLAPTIANAA
jgi:hypothetical protein